MGEVSLAVEIEAVALADVLPVRHRVLRPHQRPDEVVFDGDGAADTLHVGAFADGALVAVATILRQPPPASDDPNAWRLRAIGTDPDRRGLGIGSRLLARCLEHAGDHAGSLVWCNARLAAVAFYERHGFAAAGDVFDVPILGPHVEMRRPV